MMASKLASHMYLHWAAAKALQNLLRRPKFEDELDTWRERERSRSTTQDVYDGSIWRSFSAPFPIERFNSVGVVTLRNSDFMQNLLQVTRRNPGTMG